MTTALEQAVAAAQAAGLGTSAQAVQQVATQAAATGVTPTVAAQAISAAEQHGGTPEQWAAFSKVAAAETEAEKQRLTQEYVTAGVISGTTVAPVRGVADVQAPVLTQYLEEAYRTPGTRLTYSNKYGTMVPQSYVAAMEQYESQQQLIGGGIAMPGGILPVDAAPAVVVQPSPVRETGLETASNVELWETIREADTSKPEFAPAVAEMSKRQTQAAQQVAAGITPDPGVVSSTVAAIQAGVVLTPQQKVTDATALAEIRERESIEVAAVEARAEQLAAAVVPDKFTAESGVTYHKPAGVTHREWAGLVASGDERAMQAVIEGREIPVAPVVTRPPLVTPTPSVIPVGTRLGAAVTPPTLTQVTPAFYDYELDVAAGRVGPPTPLPKSTTTVEIGGTPLGMLLRVPMEVPVEGAEVDLPEGFRVGGQVVGYKGEDIYLPPGYEIEGDWVTTPVGAKIRASQATNVIPVLEGEVSPVAPVSPLTGGWGPKGTWATPTGPSLTPVSELTATPTFFGSRDRGVTGWVVPYRPTPGYEDAAIPYSQADIIEAQRGILPTLGQAEVIRGALEEERLIAAGEMDAIPARTELVAVSGMHAPAEVPAEGTTWVAVPKMTTKVEQAGQFVEFEWGGETQRLDVTGLDRDQISALLPTRREVAYGAEELATALGISLDEAQDRVESQLSDIAEDAGRNWDQVAAQVALEGQTMAVSRDEFIRNQVEGWDQSFDITVKPEEYSYIDRAKDEVMIQSPATGEWVSRDYLKQLTFGQPGWGFQMFAEQGIEPVESVVRRTAAATAADAYRLTDVLQDMVDAGYGTQDAEGNLGGVSLGDVRGAYQEGLISLGDARKLFGSSVADGVNLPGGVIREGEPEFMGLEEWVETEPVRDPDYYRALEEGEKSDFWEQSGARFTEIMTGGEARTEAYDWDSMMNEYRNHMFIVDAVNKGQQDVIDEAYSEGLFGEPGDPRAEEAYESYTIATENRERLEYKPFEEHKEDYFKGSGVWDIGKYMIPVYGTALTIKERGLKSGWTYLSIAGDILLVIPVAGAVARGVVSPGIAMGARTTGVAGALVRSPVGRVAYSGYGLVRDVPLFPIQMARQGMRVVTGAQPLKGTVTGAVREFGASFKYPFTPTGFVETVKAPWKIATGRGVYDPHAAALAREGIKGAAASTAIQTAPTTRAQIGKFYQTPTVQRVTTPVRVPAQWAKQRLTDVGLATYAPFRPSWEKAALGGQPATVMMRPRGIDPLRTVSERVTGMAPYEVTPTGTGRVRYTLAEPTRPGVDVPLEPSGMRATVPGAGVGEPVYIVPGEAAPVTLAPRGAPITPSRPMAQVAYEYPGQFRPAGPAIDVDPFGLTPKAPTGAPLTRAAGQVVAGMDIPSPQIYYPGYRYDPKVWGAPSYARTGYVSPVAERPAIVRPVEVAPSVPSRFASWRQTLAGLPGQVRGIGLPSVPGLPGVSSLALQRAGLAAITTFPGVVAAAPFEMVGVSSEISPAELSMLDRMVEAGRLTPEQARRYVARPGVTARVPATVTAPSIPTARVAPTMIRVTTRPTVATTEVPTVYDVMPTRAYEPAAARVDIAPTVRPVPVFEPPVEPGVPTIAEPGIPEIAPVDVVPGITEVTPIEVPTFIPETIPTEIPETIPQVTVDYPDYYPRPPISGPGFAPVSTPQIPLTTPPFLPFLPLGAGIMGAGGGVAGGRFTRRMAGGYWRVPTLAAHFRDPWTGRTIERILGGGIAVPYGAKELGRTKVSRKKKKKGKKKRIPTETAETLIEI